MILRTYKLLENINNLLSRRGLIKRENLNPNSISLLQELPKTSEALGWTESTNVNFRITLTIEGYNLGQKYNSIGGTIAIWCTEYIWLWVILGAIIGAITLAVTIFKNSCKGV
jgi:hypothetical protein